MFLSVVHAQSQLSYTYDNVKNGDEMSYKVTKLVSETNTMNGTILLQNNTFYNYSITEGMIFTERVEAKNVNQGVEQVQTLLIVNLLNKVKLQSQNITQDYAPELVESYDSPSVLNGIPMFLYPVYTNNSYLSYVAPDFVSCHHIGCPVDSIKDSTTGDYYVIQVKYGANLTKPIVTINYSINWRTGWLEFIDYKFYTNEIRLDRVGNELENVLHVFITTIAPLSILALIGGSVGVVGISYAVYMVRKKPAESYRNYIHTKLKKKKTQKRAHTIDKSLDLLEEILEESR